MNLYQCTVNNEETNKEWLRATKPLKKNMEISYKEFISKRRTLLLKTQNFMLIFANTGSGRNHWKNKTNFSYLFDNMVHF